MYDDGTRGSHLLDLVKYCLYAPIRKLPRPIDAVRFGILLREMDVPDSLLGRSLILRREGTTKKTGAPQNGTIKWKRL